MDYFSLSLSSRLALAFVSGASVWLLMLFPSLGDKLLWRPDLPLVPVAIIFGMLVLVPFIGKVTLRLVRALALILSAVIAQALVIALTVDFPNYLGLGDLEIIINVLFGSVLLCVATGLIAPVTINLNYLTYVAGAGLFSGVAFFLLLSYLWRAFCFDPCPWWNDLVFVAGWIIWHMSVCAAIYLGGNHKSSI